MGGGYDFHGIYRALLVSQVLPNFYVEGTN